MCSTSYEYYLVSFISVIFFFIQCSMLSTHLCSIKFVQALSVSLSPLSWLFPWQILFRGSCMEFAEMKFHHKWAIILCNIIAIIPMFLCGVAMPGTGKISPIPIENVHFFVKIRCIFRKGSGPLWIVTFLPIYTLKLNLGGWYKKLTEMHSEWSFIFICFESVNVDDNMVVE